MVQFGFLKKSSTYSILLPVSVTVYWTIFDTHGYRIACMLAAFFRLLPSYREQKKREAETKG